ncbi:MAG: ATP-dependent DNA ligase [Promethearchaeota archaeon]
MLFRIVCEYYLRLEQTTKRLEMIAIMAELLKKIMEDLGAEGIEKIVYLTQGKLYPDWTGKPEIGIAEKMAASAVARALGVGVNRVLALVHEEGDIGSACEKLLSKKRQKPLLETPLTLISVYDSLVKIAATQGTGSTDLKIRSLAGLLTVATPIEARYLLRTITSNLRLGIADMSVLDALAEAFAGGKENRPSIERAYNLTSDLGYIARILAIDGLAGIEKITVTLGKPIRMMAAQKLSTPAEIIEKLEGQCFAEWKIDGERMQIHKRKKDVTIFSRRLEQITEAYPDIVSLVQRHLKAENCIVEGECVAIDTSEPNKMLPFQVLMRRRRKYGIEEMVEEIPAALFLFDCLYIDGEDLTQLPYTARRSRLEEIVKSGDRFNLVPAFPTPTAKAIDKIFREAIEKGCEGIIAKSSGSNSIYRAGGRSWLWVKLKESYQAQAIGPVDLVVVGALWGRGRRAKMYGSLLAAVLDEETERLKTVCKVGTGFSDEELEQLQSRFKPYVLPSMDPLVDSKIEANVWFKPALVFQVFGDEITRSPIHTCAYDIITPNEGLAIRFPRFDGTWRPDKSWREATTVNQIITLYKEQTRVQT